MYRCVCDWLGLPYKEEVQWVGVIFLKRLQTFYTVSFVKGVLLLNRSKKKI